MPATGSTLRVIPRRGDHGHLRPAPRVVAEILEDGTVRTAAEAPPSDEERRWSHRTISGADWTIWLERRSWTEGGPS